MKTLKRKCAFLLIPILFALITCEDPVTPPPKPPEEPDSTSHEIIWEADTLGDFNSHLNAVWGSSPNDVWVAGWIMRGTWGTNFVHYDGEKWEDYDYFHAEFHGMHGLDGNDIWAVGYGPGYAGAIIAHYDGSDWKTVYENNETPGLYAVWAAASDDVFAVGGYGTIMHYDGSSWSVMQTGGNKILEDVWGFASDDVYVAGGDDCVDVLESKPLLLHYNGTEWASLLDTVNYETTWLETVWGSSPDNVFFRGYYTETGLYQGNIKDGWNFVNVPDDHTHIVKVRGSSAYNIFLVGNFGITVHYNGHSWKMYDELLRKPDGDDFCDVMVFKNSVFIVGNEFTTLRGIVYKGIIQN